MSGFMGENRQIGFFASVFNVASVAAFAISMAVGSDPGSYVSSLFIALTFIPMIAAYQSSARTERKAAGSTALAFATSYAVFVLLVYFTQLTTVARGGLGGEARALLDYSQFGLFFSLDLLGYAMMALATFFAGLAVEPACRADRWLKALLMIHGVFAVSCMVLPILGVFAPGMPGGRWIGVAVLEFWCAYFVPVGVLSAGHFRRTSEPSSKSV